jgi:hypothetical protein
MLQELTYCREIHLLLFSVAFPNGEGIATAMNGIRKVLAVVSAIGSILSVFLALGLIGRTLSNYHPSTAFDRVAPWFVVAALVGLSLVLMRFADRNLR